jgi:S1-C subfamily serine protease
MKKILISLVLLFTFTGGYALATTVNGSFEGNPIIKLFSGGKELTVSDVPAINYKNRTMVPIYLLNQLGIETKWDPANYSVTIKLPEIIKIVHPALTTDQLKKISESVYEVFGSTADPTKASQGSGFIINGYMITNEHVAGSSAYTQVQIDGQWQKVSNYAFINKTADVMGFKVSGGTSLPYSTVLPQKDDVVYAIGYPAGELTITEGKVMGVNDYVIVHNAKTVGGSSGGILIDGKGEIIGITNAGSFQNGFYSDQAIPMRYVQQELDKIK